MVSKSNFEVRCTQNGIATSDLLQVLTTSVKPKADLFEQCWILSPLARSWRAPTPGCQWRSTDGLALSDEQCLVNAALVCCTLHKDTVDVILLIQRQHRVPIPQGGNPFNVLSIALRDTHTAPNIPVGDSYLHLHQTAAATLHNTCPAISVTPSCPLQCLRMQPP